MGAEINRVLGLPTRAALRLENWEPPPSRGEMGLLPEQEQALHEMALADGFFGNLPVGTGKTLIALLAPLVLNAKRPLLLVEANYAPVLAQEAEKFSTSFDIPKIEVLSYEKLSNPNSRRLLFKLQPDLIVADEGHNLKRMESVRTKRVIEYMSERPHTKFVTMSGTMTSRSITEYAHLLEMALGDGAPIPLDLIELGRWARTIDPWSAKLALDPPRAADWHSVSYLIGWYAKQLGYDAEEVIQKWRKQSDKDRREDAREALYERLRQTNGVMLVESGSFDGALNIYLTPLAVPPAIKHALREAQDTDSVFDAHRMATTISQGFYYEWDWPNGVPDAMWLRTRSRYHAACATVMEEDPDADSPALAARTIMEDDDYEELRPIVEAWELVKHRAPPTKTVWISKYLVEDAVARAKKLGKCIIWYEHKATAEALAEMGIPVYGEGGEVPEGSVIALSRRVYGTGWNLQDWSNQIILQPPGNGKTMEQLLGRLHRRGQGADSVETYVYTHTAPLKSFWEQSLRDSRYIAQTHGTHTKLKVATIIQL